MGKWNSFPAGTRFSNVVFFPFFMDWTLKNNIFKPKMKNQPMSFAKMCRRIWSQNRHTVAIRLVPILSMNFFSVSRLGAVKKYELLPHNENWSELTWIQNEDKFIFYIDRDNVGLDWILPWFFFWFDIWLVCFIWSISVHVKLICWTKDFFFFPGLGGKDLTWALEESTWRVGGPSAFLLCHVVQYVESINETIDYSQFFTHPNQ